MDEDTLRLNANGIFSSSSGSGGVASAVSAAGIHGSLTAPNGGRSNAGEWEYFDEAGYIRGRALRTGKDPYIRNRFNQEASDGLPSNRDIPDTPNPIVLNRGPEHLVREIILVDGFSDHLWMDNYKHHYYIAVPLAKNFAYGNIDDRLALKERLHCKPFKWYQDNVYPDSQVPESFVFGQFEQGPTDCLDTIGNLADGTVRLLQCHNTGGNQKWAYTKQGQIEHDDLCLTLVQFQRGSEVVMKECDSSENQRWTLREGGFLRHNKLNVCLDSRDHNEHGITAQRCNSALESQQWKFVTNGKYA